MAAVKIGIGRQIVIPKKVYDQLRLTPGDYLEVELDGDKLVLTPKELIEKRLAEGLEDLKSGKVPEGLDNIVDGRNFALRCGSPRAWGSSGISRAPSPSAAGSPVLKSRHWDWSHRDRRWLRRPQMETDARVSSAQRLRLPVCGR